jgi:hypothetical protein
LSQANLDFDPADFPMDVAPAELSYVHFPSVFDDINADVPYLDIRQQPPVLQPPKPVTFRYIEAAGSGGEVAPAGIPAGYTERKEFPLLTFLTAYFPDVIEATVRLCVQGNVQHGIEKPAEQPFYLEGDRIAWDRTKSTEELETLMRHLWDHTRAKRGVGSLFDTDGHLHVVKAFWRAGTEAQKTIESLRNQQEI